MKSTHEESKAGSSLVRSGVGLGIALILLFSAMGLAAAQVSQPRVSDSTAAKSAAATPQSALNLTKQPTLYVVGYAHLDTQWLWEYPQVINEFIPNTMRLNFELFEKYPHYVFNFTGANRYRMMKEYYPADYAKVKRYVAAGRWFPAGSSLEETDANSPAPESLIRNVLYGNNFCRREFGKASAEFMLPDCFGFPASLPSILAHAGVKGFGTQKLSWNSAVVAGGPNSPQQSPEGIPFNIGWWEGPDGKRILSALNALSYRQRIYYDLTKGNTRGEKPPGPNYIYDLTDWLKRIDINGKSSGLYTDYMYYGVGDIGGAPSEPSVKLLEAILTKSKTVLPPMIRMGEEDLPQARVYDGPAITVGDGPLRIVGGNADQLFLDILKTGKTDDLPGYRGDLELSNHSAGSLTSQALHKQWNHRNEVLADAAERASVAAAWLGGRPYPLGRLNEAWGLVILEQFHDTLAGTSTPRAYEFAQNNDVLATNQFVGVLNSAVSAISAGMDTEAKGRPVLVYNPLSMAREDVVEATLHYPEGAPKAVRVVDPDGRELPAQVQLAENGMVKVLFLAKVPSVGLAVYDVQPADEPSPASELTASESLLENARYRISLDQNGDPSSIFDKKLNREILSAPMRLAFQTERPREWPAWNMDWEDQQKPPRGFVAGSAKVTVVENGPVRVAVRVEREAEGSKFAQTIRLAAGDAGNRVEFADGIQWMSKEAALKATFPLAASNPQATYSWGVGTIARGNNDERKFEVASHQWFDLTDQSGEYGVTILSGSKTGSDKPDDHTLRLTLLYTPGLRTREEFSDQATQDWGRHNIAYGLASHAGDWHREDSDWQGYRLDQPLMAFEASRHAGALGKRFSLLKVNNPNVQVLAVKKAETTKEVIVRVVELRGKEAKDVEIGFAGPLAAAREVNGQEQPVGSATVVNGALRTSLTPYAIRSFAVRLAPATTKVPAPRSVPVTLKYDLAVASRDGTKSVGGFDVAGRALAAEMLPLDLPYAGIRFRLAPAVTGRPNAVAAKGQAITLPPGKYNRVYVLAASAEGDQPTTFQVGDKPIEVTVQDWGGFIGQGDTRTWKRVERPLPPRPADDDKSKEARVARETLLYVKEHGPIIDLEYTGITPGFRKPDRVAWFASHRHTAEGANEAYAYSYLFAYALELPAGAKTITLPDNRHVRVLAVTVADEADAVRPARPL